MSEIIYIPILNEDENNTLTNKEAMATRTELSNRTSNSLDPMSNNAHKLANKKIEAGKKAAIKRANQQAIDAKRANANQKKIDEGFNKDVYGAANAEKIKKEDSVFDSEEEFQDDFLLSLDDNIDDISMDDILLDRDEQLTESSVINENFKTEELKPLFIVCSFTNSAFGKAYKAVKNCTYSHASLGFSPKLNYLYTFNNDPKNDKNSGFVTQSIKQFVSDSEKSIIQVNVCFLKESDFHKIHNAIDYYKRNKDKTSYNIKNIFRIFFNKIEQNPNNLCQVCSQFIEGLFKNIGIDDITNYGSKTYATPDQLADTHNKKVYKLYSGKAKDYNYNSVKSLLSAISKNAKPLKEAFNFYQNGYNDDEWGNYFV